VLLGWLLLLAFLLELLPFGASRASIERGFLGLFFSLEIPEKFPWNFPRKGKFLQMFGYWGELWALRDTFGHL